MGYRNTYQGILSCHGGYKEAMVTVPPSSRAAVNLSPSSHSVPSRLGRQTGLRHAAQRDLALVTSRPGDRLCVSPRSGGGTCGGRTGVLLAPTALVSCQPLLRGVWEGHGGSASAHFFASRSLSMCSLNVSNGSAPTRNLTALTSAPSPWVYPRRKAGVPVTPTFWPSLRLSLILAVYLPLSRQVLKACASSPRASACFSNASGCSCC